MEPGDPPFDLAGLRELQVQARQISAGLVRVTGPDSRVDGRDGSGAVRVTIDGSGRLVDVTVASGWRELRTPAELGPAVLEAATAAESRLMDEWARATGQPVDAGDLADEPPPRDSRVSMRDPDVLASTRDLYYLAMDAIDRLGEAARAVDEPGTGPLRGHSPNRQVTVSLEQGRPVAVDIDQDFLRTATAVEISQQLRGAVEDAYRAGPRSAAARALDHSSIRELREVGADPRELMRRLGFG